MPPICIYLVILTSFSQMQLVSHVPFCIWGGGGCTS